MNDTQLMTLAREYGTPLYLFEQTALRDRVALLRECLPARAELCLAIKANPFALPIIRPYVHRLEVCSPGELNICEACGTAPEEIVLSGVYKDEAMVRHALSLGDIHRCGFGVSDNRFLSAWHDDHDALFDDVNWLQGQRQRLRADFPSGVRHSRPAGDPCVLRRGVLPDKIPPR